MADTDHQLEEGNLALVATTVVAKFPIGTFLENIAVRKNGTLLVSDMLGGQIFFLDPHAADPQSTIQNLHDFNANFDESSHEEPGEYGPKRNVMAIVEDLRTADTFYTFSGLAGRAGTWEIWRIDLTSFTPGATAKVEKVADVPQALWLNGGAMIPNTTILLMADSILGQLSSWDIATGEVGVWLHDSRLGRRDPKNLYPGVNGVKYFNGHVYATSTDRDTFVRAAEADGKYVEGTFTVLETQIPGDDFIIDGDGSAYITTHPFNSVVKLGSQRTTIVAGIAGPTALALGRTPKDERSLYITTDGGLVNPMSGGPQEALVFRVDLGKP